MKRRANTDGTIYKPKGSRFWWIAYHSGGKRHFESSKSEKKTDAKDLLDQRVGHVRQGVAVTPKVGKLTIAEGVQAVLDYQTTRGRKSVDSTERRITKHLLPYFNPDRLMVNISGAEAEAYRAHRMAEGAKLATTNRELAILRQAFRLARKHGQLVAVPPIETPREQNARTGFFERAEFDAVCEHLDAQHQAPLKFAYITGWRFKSEVLALTADRVDLDRGTVWLDAGTTKSGKPRTFILTSELRKVLEAQIESIEALKQQGVITPWIFHRADGRKIKSMRKAFMTACEKAGVVGKMFHDFRRTAVRNLERAGVPRSTAMAMVGHETEAIYKRYAIQDEVMLREGAAKLDAWTTEQQAKPKAERKGQVKQFPGTVKEQLKSGRKTA